MVIIVRDQDVTLDEPADFKGFKVVVESGDGSGLFAVGRLAHRDTAWINADAVRRLAGDAANQQWEEGFAAMLDYAKTKGWLDDAGDIQAHVEWETG
ncbi:MAG TPA: hypothetical protein VFA83_10300 [Acidimicrobiales bacterium]|nr:hypothetical protein [Acidimicrobiales bacterium]